ncbi:hypothetical protein SEA_SIXAMA_54 [Gordonia phage Sixama]|uniref:Uncharacterized protein n=1 Tax=Gordonia phage Sixama TaxID=2653271 RepID=A0A5Q2F686_9CAUD|nr:hypothetical protein PP302_gp054 [Gordonia phage Sixama]QGF20233.1 hypothetical protein SEA_SIXAMA_54 [Gordonia phage Sixama]
MPKLIINGLEVNLTVDELIEYQRKTDKPIQFATPTSAPTSEPVIVPEPEPTKDLVPVQSAIFDIDPAKDYSMYKNSRENIRALQGCGYQNSTIVRAITVAAHELDARLGACRTEATGWLLDRQPHERDLLNEFASTSMKRLYSPYLDTKKLTAPYALGVSFWYTLLEFSYDDMITLIGRTTDEALLDKVADRHTDIISDYLKQHGVAGIMSRKRTTVDLPTRKKLAKETFDLVFHEL